MFTMRLRPALRSVRSGSVAPAIAPTPERDRNPGSIRVLGFSALVALSVPSVAAAQASGTMQVGAHVVSAAAAWIGLRETRAAVAGLVRTGPSFPLVRRRTTLVQTTTEFRTTAGRRVLLVTVDHLRN